MIPEFICVKTYTLAHVDSNASRLKKNIIRHIIRNINALMTFPV